MRTGTSVLIGAKEHAYVLVLSPSHFYYNPFSPVLQEGILMDKKMIAAIEAILARGARVELLTGPNGEIKILRVRRETVPVEKNRRVIS